MMNTILLASIVWLLFVFSNLIVGVIMYQLGMYGQLRLWKKKEFMTEKEVMEKVAQSLGHVPGSEFSPFNQPEPRYRYFSLDEEDLNDLDEDTDYGFAPDPIKPKGGEG